MNLVIDDAVEVRLATKTDEEKRRPLGTMKSNWAHENTAN
jgi:small nuclear ribonucleoprotein (snRNP)-like protein